MENDIRNYYEVLEIQCGASPEEIYDGYIRSKNAYSGDSIALYSLMTEDECNNMLELIEEAYSVLSDPNKRRQYDKARGFSAQPESHHQENVSSSPEKNFPAQNPIEQTNLAQTNSYQPNMSDNLPQFGTAQKKNLDQFNEERSFTINRNDSEISKISASKKFALDYEINQDFDNQIENATEFTGELLKKIREYKNVSLQRMADMTKISKTYITHIENDEYQKLPATAYVRGFVFQYAKCLKLSPELVATSYLHHIKTLKNVKSA